jgi:hypothetical protein
VALGTFHCVSLIRNNEMLIYEINRYYFLL